jgi:hypothetical protein
MYLKERERMADETCGRGRKKVKGSSQRKTCQKMALNVVKVSCEFGRIVVWWWRNAVHFVLHVEYFHIK